MKEKILKILNKRLEMHEERVKQMMNVSIKIESLYFESAKVEELRAVIKIVSDLIE